MGRGPLSPKGKGVATSRKSPFKDADPPSEIEEQKTEEGKPEETPEKEEIPEPPRQRREDIPKEPTQEMIERYNHLREELEEKRRIKEELEHRKQELLYSRHEAGLQEEGEIEQE